MPASKEVNNFGLIRLGGMGLLLVMLLLAVALLIAACSSDSKSDGDDTGSDGDSDSETDIDTDTQTQVEGVALTGVWVFSETDVFAVGWNGESWTTIFLDNP